MRHDPDLSEIRSVADVEAWFEAMLDARVNFHPDDDFFSYVRDESGLASQAMVASLMDRDAGRLAFTEDEARRMNEAMDQAWIVARLAGEDLCDVALRVVNRKRRSD